MNTLKRITAGCITGVMFILLNVSSLEAQTTQNVIVEHFTNTNCGICGSRNPGLKSNLATSPEVFHLSVHPSRPYSSCLLNRHNVTENDDRTKYYGVYGSTPRVVVQGEVKSAGVNFTTKSLFSDKQGNTTPVDLRIETLQKGTDSLVVKVIIKTSEMHSLPEQKLYIAAVEDTVFYDAPNREKEHINVFRKTLLDQAVTIPENVGDSIEFTVRTLNHADWNASRMFALAIVQDPTSKEVEQVTWSKGDENTTTLGLTEKATDKISVYPNPANKAIQVNLATDGYTEVQIRNVQGAVLLETHIVNQGTIDVSNLSAGIYFLTSNGRNGSAVARFVKE